MVTLWPGHKMTALRAPLRGRANVTIHHSFWISFSSLAHMYGQGINGPVEGKKALRAQKAVVTASFSYFLLFLWAKILIKIKR